MGEQLQLSELFGSRNAVIGLTRQENEAAAGSD